MTEIITDLCKDAWRKSVDLVIEKGNDFVINSNRKIRQCLNVMIVIENPNKDIKEPIAMLGRSQKWSYPSINEIEQAILQKKTVHSYEYTYGQRIFDYEETLNQLDDYIIPFLHDKQHRMTRRLYVSLWNPIKDSMALNIVETPGIVGIWFKLDENRLNATAIIRNSDAFIGFPANLYQVHALLNYISKKTKIPSGKIVFHALSLHVHHDLFDAIREIF